MFFNNNNGSNNNNEDKNNLFGKSNALNNNGQNASAPNMWSMPNNNLGNSNFFGNNLAGQNALNQSSTNSSMNSMGNVGNVGNVNSMGSGGLFNSSMNGQTNLLKNNSFFGGNAMSNQDGANKSSNLFGNTLNAQDNLNKGNSMFSNNPNDLNKNNSLFGSTTSSPSANTSANAFNQNLFSAAKKDVYPGFTRSLVGNTPSSGSSMFKQSTLGSSIALGSQLNDDRSTEGGGLFSKEQLEAAKQIFANSSNANSLGGFSNNKPNNNNNKLTFSGGFSSSSSAFAKNNINPFQSMALQATSQGDKSPTSPMMNNNNTTKSFFASANMNNNNEGKINPFGMSSMGTLGSANKMNTFDEFNKGMKPFNQNEGGLFGTKNNANSSTSPPLLNNFNISFSSFSKTNTSDIFKSNNNTGTTPFFSSFNKTTNNENPFSSNSFKSSGEVKSSENSFLFNNSSSSSNLPQTNTFSNSFSLFANNQSAKGTTTGNENKDSSPNNLLTRKPVDGSTNVNKTPEEQNKGEKPNDQPGTTTQKEVPQTGQPCQSNQSGADKPVETENEKVQKETPKEKTQSEENKLDEAKIATESLEQSKSVAVEKDNAKDEKKNTQNEQMDSSNKDEKTEKTEKTKDSTPGLLKSNSLFGSSIFKSDTKESAPGATSLEKSDQNKTATSNFVFSSAAKSETNEKGASEQKGQIAKPDENPEKGENGETSEKTKKDEKEEAKNEQQHTVSSSKEAPPSDQKASEINFNLKDKPVQSDQKSEQKEDNKKPADEEQKGKEPASAPKPSIFNFNISSIHGSSESKEQKDKTDEEGKSEVKKAPDSDAAAMGATEKTSESKADDKKKFWSFSFTKKKETKDQTEPNDLGEKSKSGDFTKLGEFPKPGEFPKSGGFKFGEFSKPSDPAKPKDMFDGANRLSSFGLGQNSLFGDVNKKNELKNEDPQKGSSGVGFPNSSSLFGKAFQPESGKGGFFSGGAEKNNNFGSGINSSSSANPFFSTKVNSSMFAPSFGNAKIETQNKPQMFGQKEDEDVDKVGNMINFMSLENRKKNVYLSNHLEHEEKNTEKKEVKQPENINQVSENKTVDNQQQYAFNFQLKETKGTLRNNENTKEMNFEDFPFLSEQNARMQMLKLQMEQQKQLEKDRKNVEKNIRQSESCFKKDLDKEMIIDVISNLSSFVKNKINFMNYCSNEILDIYNKVAHYDKMYSLILEDQIKIEKKQESLEKRLRLIESEQCDMLSLLNELDNENSLGFLKILNEKNVNKDEIINSKNLHLDIENFEKLVEKMSGLEELMNSLHTMGKDDFVNDIINKCYANDLNCEAIEKQLNGASSELRNMK
ncbi:nucleoporin NUP138, putative [Plasmodium vivax]|uniref:Nucleoporin NUP138, putative n=1 Tax=Plasmodium vivax TaxID=5855 RepID=A0A564ZRX5_PLAVI|nr:nucleoporin NUP138, putative [Plasmodium vivax]